MLALLDNLLHFLTGTDWTYLILAAICAGDAVFPILPSETAAIICGVQAARGELSLPLVLTSAAVGAFIGDNLSYCGGRFLGRPIQERFFSGEKAQRRLEWAKRFLAERGSYVFIVARFIPGGRTAATFTAGLIKLSWPTRFVPYVAIAAMFWSAYSVMLGYLGGHTFRDRPVYALLLAFGIAGLVTLAVEGVRRLRGSSEPSAPGSKEQELDEDDDRDDADDEHREGRDAGERQLR